MLLSIRQYAIFFILLIIILVSAFAFKINSNLGNTRLQIEASQRFSALVEIEHAIARTLDNIRQSADKISQWQEVKQQIYNPEIFAYWYNVRLKKSAFDLQKYTRDLMIYDVNGRALDNLTDSTLPYEINVKGIDAFSFRIISKKEIIYILPIYSDDESGSIIGYLSVQMEFMPLLKSLGSFQYVELDTLGFHPGHYDFSIQTLKPANFSYELHKSGGILVLEAQMRDSIIELVLIMVIPTMVLYAALVFIVGIPIKEINQYINRLRSNPDVINDKNYHSIFQVQELKSVYDSLKKYHIELTQNEEHISLTLNSIGDAVIATDAQGNITRMNPVAEQLTGWMVQEAQGQSLKTIFPIIDAATRKPIENPIEKVLATGEIVNLGNHTTLISKDGSEYQIADSVAPIRDMEGNILGLVLVFNDVTEQVGMEEALRRTQKMDALGKLTGGIAHDFNNMLGIILGYAELLNDRLGDQPDLAKYINEIYQAGERGSKLTGKLLAFSRQKTSDPKLLNINELLQDKQHMLEKTLTARVSLVFDLESDLWPVWLDNGELEDAIVNLSINAMHAIDGNGQLTIQTRNVLVNEIDARMLNTKAGEFVLFSVTDTGRGMDEATKEKIFEPFFSTKGDKGTGLGLSQVYGFVERSGGVIKVYSEPDQGARIVLYFPRSQVVESNEKVDEENTKTDFRGHENILVVDDEPALLYLTREILEPQGYHIVCAESGKQALEILEDESIDLLLSDVIMPEIDGYQLAAIVREKYPTIKIQLASGFSDERHIDMIDDSIHASLIYKPYQAIVLLKRIRELLD